MSDADSKIVFNGFDSSNFGLKLLTRIADPPQEQEITDAVPGVQGLLDYSMMFNQRLFQPMTITYTFQKYIYDTAERSREEVLIRNAIMQFGLSKLYDSNIPDNYYFKAKCSSPSITNDPQYQKLTVTLQFTCNPPFMISEIAEGNDEWDTFNFDYDVSQDTSFTVSGTDVVPLINPGKTTLQPKMTVTGTVTVETKDISLTLAAGTYENTQIYLYSGINSIKLSGNGSISFEFYKELFA
ncbi:hypothetical protein [Liquorilactobacillus ghanensis]|uniref:hypothetical protein n=1 Tax=Liquorilactobacillus ghanensis TaxID=399370 RepID=UPI0039ECD6DF